MISNNKSSDKRSGLSLLKLQAGVFFEASLNTLFPPRCASCKTPLPLRPPHSLCDICFEILEPNIGERCEICDAPGSDSPCSACSSHPPAFFRIRAPMIYGGPIADLVTQAKFNDREDLAAALGWLLADDAELRELANDVEALIPIALGSARSRSRGYNQSAVIARSLGQKLDIPVTYALKRVRETKPQSDLSMVERHQNMTAAFQTQGKIPSNVALIDDVVTSAQTVHWAAQALLSAGAKKVVVFAPTRATFTH